MSESILTSTKLAIGIAEDLTVFDPVIMMHINTTFSVLNQLGIGPVDGYMIEGATETWDAFLGTDKRLNSVKTYMYAKVRLLFDPPQTSYLIEAMQKQIDELGWRLNVKREDESWTDPNPVSVTNDE